MRVHWLTYSRLWRGDAIRCGAPQSRPSSTDPGEVTCLNCQKHIENELVTPEEWIAERTHQTARNRARSRAVSALVEAHEEEFNLLWDQQTVLLVPEVMGQVRPKFAMRCSICGRTLNEECCEKCHDVHRRLAEMDDELSPLTDLCACGHPTYAHKQMGYRCQRVGCGCRRVA